MLLDELESEFGSRCLYTVLGVEKTATPAAIKKAYYGRSLLHHPDRVGGSASDDARAKATARFQALLKCYEILSDKERRAVYDETGSVDEEDGGDGRDFEATLRAWKSVFKKVTKQEIDDYLSKYQGSAEEENDVKREYLRFDGHFDKILEHVIGAEDQHLRELIETLISRGELKETAKWKKSASKTAVAKRTKRAKKEAKEAEEALREVQQREGSSDLHAMILKRQAGRANNFLADLEAKYAQQPATKRSRR